MSAAERLLRVEGLSVNYITHEGEIEAVKAVDLTLYRGEMLSLVGESGSGKSTLIGALLRTLGPPAYITRGRAWLRGVELLGATSEALRSLRWRQLSLVPQSAMNALNPVMSVSAQLEDTLCARGGEERLSRAHARLRAAELLSLVGIEARWLKAYPHQLSGGMRQRVAIAMALAFEPELIIMDEPTTALDVIVQAEIFEVISALRAQLGFTVLLITHDLPLTLSRSDRVGVMRAGQLLEVGIPEQLTRSPQHPYTRELVEASQASELSVKSPSKAPLSPVLIAQDLSKRYPSLSGGSGGHLALNQVSLTLNRGEIVAVVGASGSGKSTLGKLLCLLERPSEGSLRFTGASSSARSERARVQMVFQDPFGSLNSVNRVGYHIIRPLKLHRGLKEREARVEALKLLEQVGLTPAAELIDRYPHELSGGQRQRVAIARGLAPSPELLIADEPTSMLDVSLRAELLRLLRTLSHERGLSLLLITHDLDTAKALADRIIVLKAGQIVEQGPAAQVLNQAKSDYTRALWEATPRYLAPTTPSPSSSEERSDE